MTKNFNLSEFECNDGSKMPLEVYENIVKLAQQLQFLRDYTGRPITINSGVTVTVNSGETLTIV